MRGTSACTSARGTPIDSVHADETSRVRAGLSAEAFEALYRAQWEAVLNFMRFRIGPAEARDVAAEVFARAWAHRADLSSPCDDPKAWLWTTARNAATDWLRRQRSGSAAIGPDVALNPDPHETVTRRLELDQAIAAMRDLPERDRDIIALRFGAGHTNRWIAQTLGISEGNVAVRLHRALLRMRKELARESTR